MIKMKEIDCPECKGDGIVWYLDYLGYDGSQRDHEERCPRCFGEGKILIEDEDYYEDEEEE